MKNYIQHIIELFGHNEYSLGTRRRVQQWLADENPVACSSRYNGCNEI